MYLSHYLTTSPLPQEIEKKRKEVKSIKNKNRLASQQMEMAEAQNSWKKFVTKVRTVCVLCVLCTCAGG